jgi:hypothetical protein
MEPWINVVLDSMCRYVGQTVTIFTTSGGLSGSGFTGVLLSVDCNVVRLLVSLGASPACAIGSDCADVSSNCDDNNSFNNNLGMSNPLGAVCVIPICAIACFTHNAL